MYILSNFVEKIRKNKARQKDNKIKENAENTTNKRQKIKRNARLNVFVKTEKSKNKRKRGKINEI